MLTALADVAIKATDKEEKTAESLLLKAEEQPQETKEHHCPSVFQLHANLLTEEVHQPWDVIVKEQTESSPYTNTFGIKWTKSPGKMP